jgi:hypothetical protein
MRTCQTLGRGAAAAHGALLGVLFLFLLQAPLQVLGAIAQSIPAAPREPGQVPDTAQFYLMFGASLGTFVFSLALFFLFPLVQGGILGQVRDRLESPLRRPGAFGVYGRAFYTRLLGSQALMTLAMFVLLLPVMALAMRAAFLEVERGASLDSGEMMDRFLLHPAFLVGVVVLCLVESVVAMVYWVANCVVVSEGERVIASWRRALHFCREHVPALLVLWLVNLAAGLAISPFGLLGSLRVVMDAAILVPLAVVYAALIAYWGVVLSGLVMSLYLAGRSPAERLEVKEPVLAGRD